MAMTEIKKRARHSLETDLAISFIGSLAATEVHRIIMAKMKKR